jgi:hypothetical protein
VACRSCGSDELHEFKTEIPIVFPRAADLRKPPVWVFPRLLICLTCGHAEFVVPKAELQVLQQHLGE